MLIQEVSSHDIKVGVYCTVSVNVPSGHILSQTVNSHRSQLDGGQPVGLPIFN